MTTERATRAIARDFARLNFRAAVAIAKLVLLLTLSAPRQSI